MGDTKKIGIQFCEDRIEVGKGIILGTKNATYLGKIKKAAKKDVTIRILGKAGKSTQ